MIDINAIGQNIYVKKLQNVSDFRRWPPRLTGRIVYSGDGIIRIAGLGRRKI